MTETIPLIPIAGPMKPCYRCGRLTAVPTVEMNSAHPIAGVQRHTTCERCVVVINTEVGFIGAPKPERVRKKKQPNNTRW
jgi:hypothetical protein